MIKIRTKEIPSHIIDVMNAFALRLSTKDNSLWGEAASSYAEERLGWLDLPQSSRNLLPAVDSLAAWARSTKLDNVILSGMGGSSLAPEVICAFEHKNIEILDSTDPHHVARVLDMDLTHCVIVLASKSGTTIETLVHRSVLEERLRTLGLNPADHFVVITDPGSPLSAYATSAGYRLLNSDPHVGGRFSALGASGLLPSALAGVDVSELLDDAQSAALAFPEPGSPAVLLAAALASHAQESPFVEIAAPHGLGDWIEQLLAESTGKEGKGLLPIVVPALGSRRANVLAIALNGEPGDIEISASLGEHFLLWEWATALLCAYLKVNAFDQPNVAEAKERANTILNSQVVTSPGHVDRNIEVIGEVSSVEQALQIFLNQDRGYIGVMAFLDRQKDSRAKILRTLLERASGTPTTFGWGPRFLHSTGQFHKGGPLIGSFLQITTERDQDVAIPGSQFSFHQLQLAQAAGDELALRSRNLNFLHLHLHEGGLDQLVETLINLPRATS